MAVFALLVTLFVFALLADSAWAQDKDRKKSERRETRTADNTPSNNPTRTQRVGAQQVEAQADPVVTITKVGEPDTVEVGELLLYTLTVTNTTGVEQVVIVEDNLPNSVDLVAVSVNGGTAYDCVENDDDPEVVCVIVLAADESPESTDDDEATILILVEPNQVETITNDAEVSNVDSAGDCQAADLDPTNPACDPAATALDDDDVTTTVVRNRNDGRRNPDRFRDRFPPGFFDDNPFIDQYTEESDLQDAINELEALENEITNGEGTTSSSDQYGEGTTGDGGATAISGDPDEFAPETSTRGEVVDEVPTEGPLPNTGGASLWAYALPGLGLLLLGTTLLLRRYGR